MINKKSINAEPLLQEGFLDDVIDWTFATGGSICKGISSIIKGMKNTFSDAFIILVFVDLINIWFNGLFNSILYNRVIDIKQCWSKLNNYN